MSGGAEVGGKRGDAGLVWEQNLVPSHSFVQDARFRHMRISLTKAKIEAPIHKLGLAVKLETLALLFANEVHPLFQVDGACVVLIDFLEGLQSASPIFATEEGLDDL